VLHVLSNLSRQPGLRKRVIETMDAHGIQPARTEVRTCGWLAQVDGNGGSIFHWRPYSNGAADMANLLDEVLELLAREDAQKGAVAAPVLPIAGEGEVSATAPELILNDTQPHDQAA
jgi:hypothetical protein